MKENKMFRTVYMTEELPSPYTDYRYPSETEHIM